MHGTDQDASNSRVMLLHLETTPIECQSEDPDFTKPTLCSPPSAAVVLSRLYWPQTKSGCKEPDHAKYIDELPNQAKASESVGKGIYSYSIRYKL